MVSEEVLAGAGIPGGGGRGRPHSEHRFPAPSLKERCRKPVLGVWRETIPNTKLLLGYSVDVKHHVYFILLGYL